MGVRTSRTVGMTAKSRRSRLVGLSCQLVAILLVIGLLHWCRVWLSPGDGAAYRVEKVAGKMQACGGQVIWIHVTPEGVFDAEGFQEARLPAGADDETIASLVDLPKCARLSMRGTSFSEAGWKVLARLESLEVLDLTASSITDDGLEQLAGLPRLRELILNHTAVTDGAVGSLGRMRQLHSLQLAGTHVTSEGVRDLQRAMAGRKPAISFAMAPSEAHRRRAAALEVKGLSVEIRQAEGNRTEYAVLIAGLTPGTLVHDHPWTWAELESLPASSVTVRNVQLGASEFDSLLQLKGLRKLTLVLPMQRFPLGRTTARAAGLASLKLSRCCLGNDELKQVAEAMPALEELTIERPQPVWLENGGTRTIDRDGLARLRGLTGLRRLAFRALPLSTEQKAEIRKAFPRAKISWDD